jgi:hypothetical protein
MCDRCENKGVLAGLMARAGMISQSPVVAKEAIEPAPPLERETGEGKGAMSQRRPKLWELEEKHHCPVIGTCLNLEELKKIARKGGFAGHGFEPYRLHVEAVSISCSRNASSEAMHKLLERKFSLDVARFNRLRGDSDVLSLWKWHLERGEVAGPMWAALTHKAASKETRNTVYADVHMLSHQVGAGQAADLRRLENLQREHVVLQAAHAALKEAESEAAYANQALGRELKDARAALQARSEEAESLGQRLHAFESGEAMVAMGRRLFLAEAQAARATELEARIKLLEQKVGQLRAEKVRLTRELDEASAERDALERLWAGEDKSVDASCSGACDRCDRRLQGRCVLCVGGRTPLLPQYRMLAERLGVRLIHHDGGREEALARLPELLSASDAVICPTDCVGHLAYYQLKKHCKQSGKPCVLAKSSGVAGFAAALARLADGRADIQSQT